MGHFWILIKIATEETEEKSLRFLLWWRDERWQDEESEEEITVSTDIQRRTAAVTLFWGQPSGVVRLPL
jgi:hypothetical protein